MAPRKKETEKEKAENDRLTKITVEEIYKQPSQKSLLYNHFNIDVPNYMVQLDLCYLPHFNGYKYAFCLIDCASRFKASVAIKERTSAIVTKALIKVYETADKHTLVIPKVINTDGGSEFIGKEFQDWCASHKVTHKVNAPGFHLAFVERFNRTLGQVLFRLMAVKEINSGKVNSGWVNELDSVVSMMNDTVTRGIDETPRNAIEKKVVKQPGNSFTFAELSMKYPTGLTVRRLLQRDEYLDVSNLKIKIQRRRATDPIWSYVLYEVVGVHRDDDKSLWMHTIKDLRDGSIFNHQYTYWQLQESEIQIRYDKK